MPDDKAAESTKTDQAQVFARRYEILRPLGRGGMGKVFLVKDLETGRRLALKMLRSQYQQNDKIVARFRREIETVRQLDHPCIVKIFDADTYSGMTYYTMEYIKGKSLRQWRIERGRLRFSAVVRVLCLVAHALDHAHRVTIHRDISPENIMVLPDGGVRILDFGLAKLDDANEGLTIVGMNLGKLQYNAPEQHKDAANADHRADIYPLGVMFYEMLTGRLPDKKHHFSELRPDLPPECDAFLEKAMAFDREERFATAADFHRELLALYNLHQERRKARQEAERIAAERPRKWYDGLRPAALVVWVKGRLGKPPPPVVEEEPDEEDAEPVRTATPD